MPEYGLASDRLHENGNLHATCNVRIALTHYRYSIEPVKVTHGMLVCRLMYHRCFIIIIIIATANRIVRCASGVCGKTNQTVQQSCVDG